MVDPFQRKGEIDPFFNGKTLCTPAPVGGPSMNLHVTPLTRPGAHRVIARREQNDDFSALLIEIGL